MGLASTYLGDSTDRAFRLKPKFNLVELPQHLDRSLDVYIGPTVLFISVTGCGGLVSHAQFLSWSSGAGSTLHRGIGRSLAPPDVLHLVTPKGIKFDVC